MLESSQQRRQKRLAMITKRLDEYDGKGINFDKFKATLQFQYGFSRQKVMEYLQIIVDSGQAEIKGDNIKIVYKKS